MNTGEGAQKKNVEELVNTKTPILKLIIRCPYQNRNMERSNAAKVTLEKQSLEEKLKNYRKKASDDQKVNVAFGSGKGKVTVISKEDLNPVLIDEENKSS